LSSRKRLSNLFKSFSDKKDNSKNNGSNTSGSLTGRIRRSLFRENSTENETMEIVQSPVSRHDSFEEGKSAPIATPERSKSSSGETLEEIKEEIEVVKAADENPCTTESSTTSSLPPTSTILTTTSRMSPPPMLQTSNMKPVRMKQRSGQRAFSESEAQSFLMQQTNAVTSIVSGASITSMASTGSYTDNPGYLTLRSIHSRHRPVLDFIETGAGSEDHHHHEHSHGQELQKRSESFSKKRHPSGSGKRMSFMSNRKKLLAPLKDAEDLSKSTNDRYWGITLPAKMELILNDGLETLPCGHSNGELSTPPSPVSFDYHSEENCLKCFNYLETPETGPHLKSRNRSSSLTCSTTLPTEPSDDMDRTGTKSTIGSPINLRKHVAKKSSAALQEIELARHRLQQRREALKIISTLNATVGASKTEDLLLKMKQQSPLIFKDLCFYSEVCQLMCHFSFRLSSRRFLQELFMDVNFEILAEDARSLLASHKHYSNIETEENNQPIQE